MKLLFCGTDYTSLVLGVCFAVVGHSVTYTDIDINAILVESGQVTVFEADLIRLIRRYMEEGRLAYRPEDPLVYEDAGAVFLGEEYQLLQDGTYDLSGINAILRKIAAGAVRNMVIAVNSTLPVGASERLELYLKEFQPEGTQLELAYNPQFCSKGSAVHDTLHAKRIIIGTQDKQARELLSEIYEPFQIPILVTSRKSAEMIKLATSNFLALKLAYINEIASLCDLTGIDLDEVTRGLAGDDRIGGSYLSAGIGFGGSGLPKDMKSMLQLAKKYDYTPKTVLTAIELNKEQTLSLYHMVRRMRFRVRDSRVAVLGLTYKAGTEDCTASPAIENIRLLLQEGADIYAYDPVGISNFKKIIPEGSLTEGNITYTDNIFDTLCDAELCFIFTGWGKFKAVNPEMYRKLMKNPIVLDGTNLYSPISMRDAGVEYYSIGRNTFMKQSQEITGDRTYLSI